MLKSSCHYESVHVTELFAHTGDQTSLYLWDASFFFVKAHLLSYILI